MKKEVVLDASALIAYLKQEKGYEKVKEALAHKVLINTVNLSEVYSKIVAEKIELFEVIPRLQALGIESIPFDDELAKISALIYPECKKYGLSLADRACLSLGIKQNAPVITADRVWSKLDLDLEVIVIR